MKTVTIVAVAGINAEGNENAILKTSLHFPCSRKLMFSVQPPKNNEIEWIKIPDFGTDRNIFPQKICQLHLTELPNHIHSEFCIIVQNDGYVVNREAWINEFFDYDYIGAPLPLWETVCIKGSPFRRVGSGGFNLRSKKFLEIQRNISYDFNLDPRIGEDILVSRILHKKFENKGCKFAPIPIAIKWCYEHKLEDYPMWNPKNSFGYHGYAADGRRLWQLSFVDAFLKAFRKSNISTFR